MTFRKESRLQKAADNIRDIYKRSGVSAGPFVEQVSFSIYLKLLDERESAIRTGREHFFRLQETKEPLYSGFAEEFRWSNWDAREEVDLQEFVSGQAIDYVQTLSREAPEVARFFKDAEMRLGDRHLKRLYEILDSIKFGDLPAVDRGDFYGELLEIIGESSEGIYRTPLHLRRLMVELADPSETDRLLDPACGTGGLLVDASEHVAVQTEENPEKAVPYGSSWLQSKYGGDIQRAKQEHPELFIFERPSSDELMIGTAKIHGIDVSRRMARLSVVNLKIRGLRNGSVVRRNALGKGGGRDVYGENMYDVVVSNPPFGRVGKEEEVRESISEIGRRARSRQDLLFLKLAMVSLRSGGRCVMTVPNNVLFGSTQAHQQVRRQLIEEYRIEAIISVDTPVFSPSSQIPVSILVFSRPEKEMTDQAENAVWFYNVEKDGYGNQRKRRPDPDQNDIPDLLEKWEKYKDTGFEDPPGPNSTDVLNAGSTVQCWWATGDQIDSEAYDLSPSRYRPRIEQEPGRSPGEILDDLEDVEKRIRSDIQRLRDQLN
jgi:type I restriction enzyme M protein